jgi:2-polyprenyl-3-methyl-5-hydroxy-6-metoxy-1,4-benzoquinol methylase
MEFAEFVVRNLPKAPIRVLEIGCGTGELALTRASGGYLVTKVSDQLLEVTERA